LLQLLKHSLYKSDHFQHIFKNDFKRIPANFLPKGTYFVLADNQHNYGWTLVSIIPLDKKLQHQLNPSKFLAFPGFPKLRYFDKSQ